MASSVRQRRSSLRREGPASPRSTSAGFEPGYPEISPKNARFSLLKERGLFVTGSPDAEVHRVLTDKILARQATVVTAEAFQSDLGST